MGNVMLESFVHREHSYLRWFGQLRAITETLLKIMHPMGNMTFHEEQATIYLSNSAVAHVGHFFAPLGTAGTVLVSDSTSRKPWPCKIMDQCTLLTQFPSSSRLLGFRPALNEVQCAGFWKKENLYTTKAEDEQNGGGGRMEGAAARIFWAHFNISEKEFALG